MGIVEREVAFGSILATLEALRALSIQRSLFFMHIYSTSKSNSSWPKKCRLSEMRIMLHFYTTATHDLHSCFRPAAASQAVFLNNCSLAASILHSKFETFPHSNFCFLWFQYKLLHNGQCVHVPWWVTKKLCKYSLKLVPFWKSKAN